ncbi:hypothetical protein HDV04_004748 [Boothiomyces sp. JEL0838]|nr:hypothetical protein HDV04_004748 [Boothiomyces sp. JEL0838]
MLFFPIVQAATNLIQNGGFEDKASTYCPTSNIVPYCYFNSSSYIVPWVSNSDTVPIEVGTNAFQSNWSVDLSSTGPYSISQSVNLTPNEKYILTFELAGNDGVPNTKTGFVNVTGVQQQNFSHNKGDGWVMITYSFTAVQQNSLVTIGSTTEGEYGPLIDNVVLVSSALKTIPLLALVVLLL